MHENPHVVAECYFQHHFSVNVMCGVLGKYIIGPNFAKGCLAAAYYKDFLQNDLLLHLKDVPLATRGRMWIQHDRAPTYFSREVMEFLSDNYHDRRLGRGGLCHGPFFCPTYHH
jgi:hypothetical protein